MNKSIYNYLKNYDNNILSINRLLVSAFIYTKSLEVKNNKKLNELLIKKENKEEFKKLQDFLELILEVDKKFCFEELLELFEFVVSPSDKLINGAVYTPKDIREFITDEAFNRYKNKNIDYYKVVDISCGCGGFLIDATRILKKRTSKSYKEIFKENIFGVDIQEYSIERTKILLSLFALENSEDETEFEFNLYVKDSLEFDWREENQLINENNGFDIILGNPPYVCSRNMDEKTKSLMSKWDTCSTGHPDLYIPFFEIGHKLLNKTGILGYITVNSFIKSFNGRAIRKYFQDNQIDIKIIDFEDEQIFNSRMTYTAICFLTNQKSDEISYIPLKRLDILNSFQFQKHKYSELSIEKGWYLKNRDIVKKIEKIGTPLGDIYNTKSGIATLKNSVFIFKPLEEIQDENYYYINENLKVEKGICKNIVNSNLLVKTNNIDLHVEKIIFPYDYDENQNYYVIPEDELKEKFPMAYQYLVSNKEELGKRDKGKGKDYKFWYAFGRNQSLERKKYQLLFPQLAKKEFKSSISDDSKLYFYNGMSALSNDLEELKILEKILVTDIFWTYVSSISKHYASNYFSLGRNYIKNFGIYNFTDEEKSYLLNEEDNQKVNNFINKKYLDLINK